MISSCKHGDVTDIQPIQLSLSPNPASYIVSISVDAEEAREGTMSLYDISGRKLLHQKFSGTTDFLDVSSLQQGMYFLEIRSQDFSMVKKLEVVR